MSDTQRVVDSAREVIHTTVNSGAVPGVVAGMTNDQETLFIESAGVRSVDNDQPMTDDTVFSIFSTTKALTGTVALQLVESGDLDLDSPAEEYAPAIGELQVIEGFDSNGEPMLRAPKTDITTRQLLLHTAGFGYDFFNETYNRLAENHGQPSIVTATKDALETPLLFDPGTQWEYGSNIDWAGQVIEGIVGTRLGEALKTRVLDPLGMTSTSFTPSDDMRARLATMHQRTDDGLQATDFVILTPPEVDMGGHGLFSTVGDYLAFIRMWLNDGEADDGTVILRPDTVEWATRNDLGDLTVKMLPGVIRSLSNDAEFFPGQRKGWCYTFMTNETEAPTGRPAGSLAWAGLANLYYWIDRHNKIGGYWATQIFPFADPSSLGGYLDMETAVYRALS
ncbi:serine hydrolase [Rhodococcus sp. LW-XY12]|uniref:serine hydrolase domain-containing protein n=1 Tax=Rhodococcus sp. LW-XY12 TaxID=2856851 RepID=UPI001C587842|nr:serine hydrolase domain-containing protein [Rhodococcus sp. LW-XY12]QXU53309.1 beta-lactamase family protein [Rhodococcus sp. LW-XY12]